MRNVYKTVWAFTAIIIFSFATMQDAQAQAIGGYDTVSYFSGKPVRGKQQYSTQWDGQTWFFSSSSNLKKFQNDPERFAPQYDGQCAFAVAHGSSAPGSPNQWTVHRGKLYFNLNAGIKRQWLSNKQRFIDQADDNWGG